MSGGKNQRSLIRLEMSLSDSMLFISFLQLPTARTGAEGIILNDISAGTSFPPASMVEDIKAVPSVCLCGCLSVSALPAELFDVWT